MLTAAAVYMFTHLSVDKARFAMYGRHVDMLVPIVVIYALGSLDERSRPRWSTGWLLSALGGLLLTLILFGLLWGIGGLTFGFGLALKGVAPKAGSTVMQTGLYGFGGSLLCIVVLILIG